ncbi:MarC family protein [Alphaproteobacteria bacterium]|nr:MarC family protein [Alphaproteobacteria bacterium]MDC1120352.1 MarC family protein [Alphaproteobacteria bacterium]
MLENFITAFIVYVVVIGPIGNSPIFLAITAHLSKRQKIRTAIEGSIVAAAIMLFFALCGAWILHYLAISFSAFKIAGGIILLLVAIDMLSNRRQQRKEQGSDIISPEDNVAIFPLAIPLLAGPAAITSVMVVSSGGTGSLKLSLLGLGALAAVLAITAVILIAASLAEAYIDKRVTSVFSRITAIILAALSIQNIIDGPQTLDGLSIS